jgi:hypothetical protein
MLKRMIALLIFWMASVAFISGCASTSVYVLNEAELIRVKKDQAITAKFDGWLLSDRAVDRVMNAKIKATNLQ